MKSSNISLKLVYMNGETEDPEGNFQGSPSRQHRAHSLSALKLVLLCYCKEICPEPFDSGFTHNLNHRSQWETTN